MNRPSTLASAKVLLLAALALAAHVAEGAENAPSPEKPVGAAEQAEKLVFNRDIRPILSSRCFKCHGPDDKHRQADLRLDTKDGIALGFEPGKLDDSEAWRRVMSEDPEEMMPPPSSNLTLSQEEKQRIRRWVEQGAEWQEHWAFMPPKKPALPAVKNSAWPMGPIDYFILARLERAGLEPSRPARREQLLRRVTFDLTGLPPTLQEIDDFLKDTSPNAYEKVVDRLLASPRFGERMALAWMDAARYGDSSVFHADGPRDMWPWRDWVIAAYNANKPFDEFTVEQLAGDLLPGSTLEQKIATGFNRNNATTDEGGVIPEEFRVEYAVDRVQTTSMVWLGMTYACGQCHNHKYDPLSQREYYQLYAYFNQAADPGMQTRRGNQAPLVNVPDRLALAAAGEWKAKAERLQRELAERSKAAEPDFDKWLAKAAAQAKPVVSTPGNPVVHVPLDDKKGRGVKDLAAPKRKGQVKGKPAWTAGKLGGAFRTDARTFIDLGAAANFDGSHGFSYGAWLKPPKNAAGAPIARMNDRNNYRGYDLYLSDGRVSAHVINTWPSNAIKVTTKQPLKADQWQHVFVTYDGSGKAAGVKIYVDGKSQPWDIEQDGLSGSIQTKAPLQLGRRSPGSPYTGEIDDVRIYGRVLTEAEVGALAGHDPIAPILATAKEKRTPAQNATLRAHYLNAIDPEYKRLTRELGAARRELAAAQKPLSTVMVMQDVAKPRVTYMLDRGSYDAPLKDKPVEPGTPAILPPLPKDAPPNRLGLAQWLVQERHPLTARVAVNRYWYMLFGRGIVETLGDFGSQGAWPSHPALLDYLAVDFEDSGWDIKRMLKQMVMSATYRQTSAVTTDRLAADPQNRLLSRGPRFRLQAEFLRDAALAASGLLVDKIGGPGVKPYQPPGLWNEVSLSGNVRFKQDSGAKLYRRGMYTYWKRSAPAPAMVIFDAPTREKCALRRSRTNTPLQALVTLNDPQFVEAARQLAERAIREGGDKLEDRIAHAYRLTTAERPSGEVLTTLKAAYEEELAVFAADEARANALLAVGYSKPNDAIPAAQHAAMTVVASMIMNLDVTVTRN